MRETQWSKIRAYLKEHGTATVRELFALGINSPTKRLSEMIERGEEIGSMWDTHTNMNGETTRFKRYYNK